MSGCRATPGPAQPTHNSSSSRPLAAAVVVGVLAVQRAVETGALTVAPYGPRAQSRPCPDLPPPRSHTQSCARWKGGYNVQTNRVRTQSTARALRGPYMPHAAWWFQPAAEAMWEKIKPRSGRQQHSNSCTQQLRVAAAQLARSAPCVHAVHAANTQPRRNSLGGAGTSYVPVDRYAASPTWPAWF